MFMRRQQKSKVQGARSKEQEVLKSCSPLLKQFSNWLFRLIRFFMAFHENRATPNVNARNTSE